MNCPECKKIMKLVKYFDKRAFQCKDHFFSRVLLDGTVQNYCVNMDTGVVTWRKEK